MHQRIRAILGRTLATHASFIGRSAVGPTSRWRKNQDGGTNAGSSANVRDQQNLSRSTGARARRSLRARGRVSCAGRRERRREEHVDEDPLRCLRAGRGQIAIDDKPVIPRNPHHAQQLGISIIYQEFNLFPNMIDRGKRLHRPGTEPRRGFVDRTSARGIGHAVARAGWRRTSIRGRSVRDLSVAQQQMVEIAKALSYNARIVIMDEPTSALDQDRSRRAARDHPWIEGSQGLGIIFISHRLEEIFAICDRITVLRDGRNAGELPIGERLAGPIVQLMVGRAAGRSLQKAGSATARRRVVLEVRGLSRTGTAAGSPPQSCSMGSIFRCAPGEIVGLAGLVGSGRTEVARAIFGADHFDSGEILIDGEPVADRHLPREAIRRGHRPGAGRPQAAGAGAAAGGAREHQPAEPGPADHGWGSCDVAEERRLAGASSKR